MLLPTRRPAAFCAPAKGLAPAAPPPEPVVAEGFAGVKPVKVGVNVTRGVLVVGKPAVAETGGPTAPAVEVAPVTVKGVRAIPPTLQLFKKSRG